MDKILIKITELVTEYESGKWISVDNLRVMQRQLSTNIYKLTQHNINAFNEWNGIVYNETTSNAKAVTKADFKVPELRMSRKILEAARGVSIAMNSELSILKKD
jgi:hypothetical protein